MDKGMVIEKYLESIDSMPFGKNLSNIPVPTNMTESWCIALDKAAYETARNLRAATTFKKLENNVTILLFSYLTIIENQLNTTIPIYEKALGGIEEFVERYHRMILFIPSTGIINLYQSIIVGMVGVAVFVTISLTVLMIIEYEFMRKWIQKTILASVFLINFFAVFSLLLFLALIYRICFIEVVHWQSQQNQFETLRKVDPTNLVENGHNYSINYGLILQKSLKERRTLFNLLTDKEIPDCINVEKVFKPNGVYNETVRSLSRITVDEYGNWVNSSCEAATRASDILLRKLMTKCSYSVDIHQRLNSTKKEVCQWSRSIDKSKVFETAYSKWTETISSYAWKAITERASATDERSPIQMYMVFENPSKKLRPTVLEHLFRMAFLILRIVPIYVVLSVFLMCIIPLLMSDEINASRAYRLARVEHSRPLRHREEVFCNEALAHMRPMPLAQSINNLYVPTI
uniref:Chloride channel CLIC-like protein 1 n=1 Tax=Caenorhabditis tropicalis TaxID=1561998 RepID=A0A1I7UD57_9PELO